MNYKIASLALIAALGTASVASASESYFTFGNTISDNSTVSFDLIRSEGAGMVAIYDYTGGMKGELLGMTDLRAGSNTDVKVGLPANGANQLLAEIVIDGQVVAAKDYYVRG